MPENLNFKHFLSLNAIELCLKSVDLKSYIKFSMKFHFV